MEARSVAIGVAVLLILVIGAQLTYTTVGQPVGERWSSPTVAVADDAVEVREVAAAGDDDGGVVAWIIRNGDHYRLSLVPVTVEDGEVSLGSSRTIASGDRRLQGLSVDAAGDDIAVTWERAVANEIVLYRATTDRTRVVSQEPLRAAEPSVALVDEGALVGWQEWNDPGFAIELAGVTEGGVIYRSIAAPTGGTGSPSVNAVADGFAVTWFDADARTANMAFGAIESGSIVLEPRRTLGRAQPAGGFGGGTGPVAVDAGAEGDVVRAVWLDLATVMTTQATSSGSVAEPTPLGPGERPRTAVADDRWLAAWVVTGRAADNDLVYASGGADRASGDLSRFESSANHPSPFYAPDGAVAWSERGAQSRVLVSGFRDTPEWRYADRLRTEPGRFAFIGFAAAALGIVTLPIMPWVFVSMLLAFYLTNRVLLTRAIRAATALTGRSGEEQAVEAKVEAVPPEAWATVFAIGEVALLVSFLPTVGATVPLSFAGPVVLSVAAAIGTGSIQLVVPQRSPWRLIAIFAYLQTAALWATALPDIL